MHTLAKDQSDASCGKRYNTRTYHSGRLGCAVSRIHLLYSISKDMFYLTLSFHHCNAEPNDLQFGTFVLLEACFTNRVGLLSNVFNQKYYK
ncbi:hypothetical protein Hanom_Chr05g00466151 [Helianthus anomalus]